MKSPYALLKHFKIRAHTQVRCNFKSLLFFLVLTLASQQGYSQSRTLVAEKINPGTYKDASDITEMYFNFAVPNEIPVTSGLSTGGTAVFKFRDGKYGEIKCNYKASANGSKYVFTSADFGVKAGDLFVTDYFYLRVKSGNPSSKNIKATLTLNWATIKKGTENVPYPMLMNFKKGNQVLAGGPQQVCATATPVCQAVYNNALAYDGNGVNQINPAQSCLKRGALNGMWYEIRPTTNGNLNFTITPNNASDDYDWAVYNVTNNNCGNIPNGGLEIACSYNGTKGTTGANGNPGAQNQPVVPVVAGRVYKVFVSYFHGGVALIPGSGQDAGHGFGINFGSSTANIFNTPTIKVTPATATICQGSSTVLTASGAGVGGTYSWTPATGLNTTTGAVVTASPAITTIYTVTGTNTSGCSSTAKVTVTVNPKPTVTVTPAAASICAGASVALKASGANTYKWTPAAGLNTTTGASVTASPASTSTYTVTGTSAAGCTNTKNVTVKVNPNPTVNATLSIGTICNGSSTKITASGANTYNWSPATGLNTTTGAIVTASPMATTSYTVTGTNTGTGCSSTKTVQVVVNPKPIVTAKANTTNICSGTSATITASGANTYVWSPATGLNTTIGKTVTANPTATTTYTVTGTNTLTGCTNSTTVTITVNPKPVLTVTPAAQTICSGSSVSLTASGANTYVWTPSTGLNTTIGSTVTASPTVTTSYTITGTTTAGCTATKQVTVTVNPSFPAGNISGYYNEMWGMTHVGGGNLASNSFMQPGVLFNLDANGNNYHLIKTFDEDGLTPCGAVIQASNGKLYGMTANGGSGGIGETGGVIFEVDPATKAYHKVLDLDAVTGTIPEGSFTEAPNKKLYGFTHALTPLKGVNIIEFDPQLGAVTKVIHVVDQTASEGTLLLASNGKMYGTYQIPETAISAIFDFDPATGVVTTLNSGFVVDFWGTSITTGQPVGSLMQATNGKLYGMTKLGGEAFDKGGILYEYDITTNQITKKVDFSGLFITIVGGSLFQASNGLLYGMTGNYAFFEYNIQTNALTLIQNLNNWEAGSVIPRESIFIESPNGKLYGMTQAGGSSNCGTVFEYDLNTHVLTKKLDFTGINGAQPWGSLANVKKPATSICKGIEVDNVTFTIPAVANATSYNWTVPAGAVITSGANTNTILVKFTATAISGNISVQPIGNNICSSVATYPVLVSACGAVPRLAEAAALVNEFQSNNKLSVFPNPTDGNLNILFSNTEQGTLTITDMLGQEVYCKTIVGNESQLIIDLSAQAPGIYSVKFTGNNSSTTQNVVVK